jgi:hypothetical protein
MRKPLRKCGKDAVAQKGGFEYSAIEKYRSYLLVAAMLGQKRGKMPGYGCIRSIWEAHFLKTGCHLAEGFFIYIAGREKALKQDGVKKFTVDIARDSSSNQLGASPLNVEARRREIRVREQ